MHEIILFSAIKTDKKKKRFLNDSGNVSMFQQSHQASYNQDKSLSRTQEASFDIYLLQHMNRKPQ